MKRKGANCLRCAGWGFVADDGDRERPWLWWPVASRTSGNLKRRPCPDCGGSGAIVDAEAEETIRQLRLGEDDAP